jgi:integrase
VDLATGVARIEVQLTQNGSEVAEGEPKSDTGRRPVMLPAETVAELKAHRKEQAAERLKWGSAWIDSGRVFVREGGEHLVPDTLSERFRVLAAEAGLPPITLHGLRHGAATYALDAGVDIRVVQEMLGHSSSVLTRDTYTSVSERLQQDAAERVSSIIPRAAATGTAPRGSAR